MRSYVVVVVLAMIATSFAAESAKLAAKRKAREELIAKMGGYVSKPDKEPGIVFMNCQTSVPPQMIDQALMTVRHEFHRSCFLRTGEFKGINDLIAQSKDRTKVSAMIAVVDDPSLPQLLSAPDSRVSVINVRPLMADDPIDDILHKRVWHMVYRGFGIAMGAAWSAQEAGLMRPAENLEDLDKITGRASAPDSHFPIDAFCRANKVASGGVQTYRDACLDGWAPAPTNDIQKAIWEGVKSGKIKDE